MAVEGKKGGYHSPPWTHYIFGFLTLPTSTLLRGFAPRGQPPCYPTLARSWTSVAAPDGYEALHFCNHRQLVPSDYTPLNAVLSAVAHSNTERD